MIHITLRQVYECRVKVDIVEVWAFCIVMDRMDGMGKGHGRD